MRTYSVTKSVGKARLSGVSALALAVGLTVAGATAAGAETFTVQSSFNAGDFAYQYLSETWLPKLGEMTNGEVSITLLASGAVVPTKETADVIAAGILDGDFTTPIYFSGQNPAFAILGDLTAAYDTPAQQLGFCKDGPGEQVFQSTYDATFGEGKIHVVACGPYTRESLPATKKIAGVADMKGMKIRAPEGLSSEVFRRAGATPINIPYSEVYTALQTGVVDAADASAYVNNDAAGINKIATYPIYPGIHSQAVLQLTLNGGKWASLSEANQKALRDWWYAAMEDLTAVSDQKDKELVARDLAGDEVHPIDWPQADRDAFREIAKEAWAELAAKTPEAQAALDAHIAYMKEIGLLK